MKISSSFWRFPGSEWESATLSPNFHFFFICDFICFFIFLCFWWFSIVFHCFSWLSWISGATGKENEKKMKKQIKKWKKKKENFLEFLKISWFEVRICNFESKFSFFFHLRLHFFSFSFVFDGFPLFFIVFHGFPGFQVPRARKMKKNDKKMKNKWKFPRFWRFPGSEWESATLSPNFHFFSFATSFFFHFPLFLTVFHCFSLFFMAFLDFRCHGQGKWKKNEKTMKKIKKKWKMKISSSFWRFPGSEWESATLSPNFHFFFICNFIFFSLSFVFHCFSWLSWISGSTGREMKKNENFREFLKISWFGVRICNFESKFSFFFHLQLHFFFIFLCFWWFSIVFHCFSWFSWISGATGKENEKKMIKQWSLKWKKMKFEMKKNDVWNEKNEVWRNKKRKKNEKQMKNKWKQKNDWKTKWKKMKLQMKTQMKNKWKKIILNISNLWLDANHITLTFQTLLNRQKVAFKHSRESLRLISLPLASGSALVAKVSNGRNPFNFLNLQNCRR